MTCLCVSMSIQAMRFTMHVCTPSGDFHGLDPDTEGVAASFSSTAPFVVRVSCKYGQADFPLPMKINEWLLRATQPQYPSSSVTKIIRPPSARATDAGFGFGGLWGPSDTIQTWAASTRSSPPISENGDVASESMSTAAAAATATAPVVTPEITPTPIATAVPTHHQHPPADYATTKKKTKKVATSPLAEKEKEKEDGGDTDTDLSGEKATWVDVNTKLPVRSAQQRVESTDTSDGKHTLIVCKTGLPCRDAMCFKVHGRFERRQEKYFVSHPNPYALYKLCVNAYHGRCVHYVDGSCTFRHFTTMKRLDPEQLQTLKDRWQDVKLTIPTTFAGHVRPTIVD